MTTNKEISAKAKKIAAQRDAYKDLMKMKPYFSMARGKDQKDALNKTLFSFGTEGCPVRAYDCEELLEPQRRVAQLLIAAGADPNYSGQWTGRPIRCVRRLGSPIKEYRHETYDDGYSWSGQNESVFEMFVRLGKPHCAIEMARANGFARPAHLDEIFTRLDKDLRKFIPFECPEECPEDFELRKRLNSYQKGLVSVLFKKGMYPSKQWLHRSLACVAGIEDRRVRQAQSFKRANKISTGGRISVTR